MKLNKKGVIFSLDLVFAVVLFVFLLGVLYSGFSFALHQYNIKKANSEFNSYIDFVENKFALNKNFSCNLVDKDGNFIKYLSYCVNPDNVRNEFFDLPDNVALSLSPSFTNFVSFDVEKGIEKEIYLIISDVNITKERYYNCVMGLNCDLNLQKIKIGVGYK